ncbi:PREDICTED: zinc finger protein ZAT4-like [Ipomoea nil]|uniref:zinc finger protein ZAT4-like n=1 Tax=Ipomoea nil TaxID=35883 RepID=UPI0009011DA5|nr:PREDICTED: zinc finger protein ZAT4-like [Ipomoea nil]
MVFREEEEEEAEEQKFICKFCNKVCLSGRSLGGHMRGHLHLIAAAKKQRTKADQNSVQSRSAKIREKGKSMVLGEDDGLTENPNKSWKVFYSNHRGLERENLSDHQRRYEEEEEHHLCKKCGKVFDTIRALNGHMQIHSKRSRLSREESMESLSDMENQCPVQKKRSAIRYGVTENSPFSSVASDLEEAAVCLMMLSRGFQEWDFVL